MNTSVYQQEISLPTKFNAKATSLLVFLGAIFWLAAALVVRSGADAWLESSFRGIMYVAAVPITFGFFAVTMRLLALPTVQMAHSAALLIVSATVLDALAMNLFPSLYAETPEVLHYGASFILWGVALGLVIGAYATIKATDVRFRLSTNVVLLYIGIGVGIWVSGVIMVRSLHTVLFQDSGFVRLALYATAIPANWIMVWGLTKAIPAARGHLLVMMTVASAAAAVLDGLSLSFYPEIYVPNLTEGAALVPWLLFFFGHGLLAAYVLETKPATKH